MLNREDMKIIDTAIKYYKMNLLTESDMKTITALAYSNAIEDMLNKSIENTILPFTNKMYKDILKNYAKY